jgi:hypothetical protein
MDRHTHSQLGSRFQSPKKRSNKRSKKLAITDGISSNKSLIK